MSGWIAQKNLDQNWQRCSIILKRACQKGWEGGQKWETEELSVENWWPSFNRNIKVKNSRKNELILDIINIIQYYLDKKGCIIKFWNIKKYHEQRYLKSGGEKKRMFR